MVQKSENTVLGEDMQYRGTIPSSKCIMTTSFEADWNYLLKLKDKTQEIDKVKFNRENLRF